MKNGMKRLSVDLTENEWKKLSLNAIQNDETKVQIIRKLIKAFLDGKIELTSV